MRFLVSISATRWQELDEARQIEVGAREEARGAELVREGTIEQIWRVPGTRNNVGVWNCIDADELHKAISSLPAWPWLEVSVQQLATHPLIGLAEVTHLTSPSENSAPEIVHEDTQRCVLYYLKDGAQDEYDEFHAAVWPEVKAKIRAEGKYDYSIFRRGEIVISVFRTRGPMTEELRTVNNELNDRWSALMRGLLRTTTDENDEPLTAQRIFRLP